MYRCVLFFKTSPVFGKVSARLGVVSLFTCVSTVFLLKYKTNLVPSFLPALSGSACIISSANHYNTSVDAALVQRLESDFPVECVNRMPSGSQKCCYHILSFAVFMVGWKTKYSLFFKNISAGQILYNLPHILLHLSYCLKKLTLAFMIS